MINLNLEAGRPGKADRTHHASMQLQKIFADRVPSAVASQPDGRDFARNEPSFCQNGSTNTQEGPASPSEQADWVSFVDYIKYGDLVNSQAWGLVASIPTYGAMAIAGTASQL